MVDLKSIIQNIETIYGSNNSLNILKDFERVIDELDLYVFDNWIDGELVQGPKESKYFVECTFMWEYEKMPDPTGAKRLSEYGCKVQFAETHFHSVRKIKTPDDIRPGTKKGKLDHNPIWIVEVQMPKQLAFDIYKGYMNKMKAKNEGAHPSASQDAQTPPPAAPAAAAPGGMAPTAGAAPAAAGGGEAGMSPGGL